MSGLPFRRLGDYLAPVNKWNPDASGADDLFTYVDISAIDQNAKEIREPQVLPAKAAPSRARQIVRTGDILVSTVRPNLNAVAVIAEKYDGVVASTGFTVLRPRPEELDSRYLYHWVRSKEFVAYLVSRATGASYPAVSDGVVKDARIPMPFIDDQRHIASILDTADAIRHKRQQALTLVDDFLRSTFLEMFGCSKSETYPRVSLGSILKVASGNGLVASAMRLGQFPVYGGNGVNGWHDEYMFAEEKIVIGRVGVYCGCIHLTKPYSWVTDNALYVKEIYRKDIDKTYLLWALRFADLNRYASQAAQPLISGGRIYSVEILLPPFEKQAQFAAYEQRIVGYRQKLANGTEEADGLFASLSQRAFRGEL